MCRLLFFKELLQIIIYGKYTNYKKILSVKWWDLTFFQSHCIQILSNIIIILLSEETRRVCVLDWFCRVQASRGMVVQWTGDGDVCGSPWQRRGGTIYQPQEMSNWKMSFLCKVIFVAEKMDGKLSLRLSCKEMV